MTRITGSYPMHGEKLVLMDGTEIEDVDFMLCKGEFIVYFTRGKEKPDLLPLGRLDRIEGVNEQRPVPRIDAW